MKFFVAFVLLFISFCDGKAVPLNPVELRDPPPATNVSINVTWTFTSGVNVTYVVMTIRNLDSSQYAAMGFGQHQAMGEAHVFICKRFANDDIAIQRFINPLNHTHPKPAGSEDGGVFTPLPSTFVDGVVTCRYALSNFASATVENVRTLTPLTQTGSYHPIFSVGLLNSTGDVQYHDGREARPNLVQLNQGQNLVYHENSTSLFFGTYTGQ